MLERKINYKVSKDTIDLRTIKCEGGVLLGFAGRPKVEVSVLLTNALFLMMSLDNLSEHDVVGPLSKAVCTARTYRYRREVLVDVAGNMWVFVLKGCLVEKEGVLRLIYEQIKELN